MPASFKPESLRSVDDLRAELARARVSSAAIAAAADDCSATLVSFVLHGKRRNARVADAVVACLGEHAEGGAEALQPFVHELIYPRRKKPGRESEAPHTSEAPTKKARRPHGQQA